MCRRPGLACAHCFFQCSVCGTHIPLLRPQFSFKHNVVERTIYAEGTVDAVLFLAKKAAEGADKKVRRAASACVPAASEC